MPAKPSSTETILDPGLGVAPPVSLTPVFYGVASAGSQNAAPAWYSQAEQLYADFGDGPAVQSAAVVLATAGGPVGFVRANPSIAASNGSITKGNATSPTVTVAGSAVFDSFARIEILTAGARGTATFRYSLDGHDSDTADERTYSETLTTPAGGSFAVPGLGVTLTFPTAGITAITRAGGSVGPAITFSGTSVSPTSSYVVEITTSGALSVGVFRWSSDGGSTWTTGVTLAATVALGATGITANFPAGSYVDDETYSAAATAYVVGDVYTFLAECAAWNAADLTAAFAGGLSTEPNWRYLVAVTSEGNADDTAHATLTAALQAELDAMATASRYRRAMIASTQDTTDTVASVATAFNSTVAARCLVGHGRAKYVARKKYPGYAFPSLGHAVTLFAARAAGCLLSTDLKRVAGNGISNGGPLPGGVISIYKSAKGVALPGGHDENKVTSTLDDKKVSTLRTHDGYDGFFVTQGRLKSASGSDFEYWPRGLIMDAASETVHVEQTRLIGKGFRVNANGTIFDADAVSWETIIGGILAAQLLTPTNAEGFAGHVQALRYVINRTHNVRTAKTILSTVGILPLNHVDWIIASLGFVTGFGDEAAAA